MKKFIFLIVTMLFCIMPVCSNPWGGQCSFEFVSSYGVVVENFTMPCDWIQDQELFLMILFEADDYLCE